MMTDIPFGGARGGLSVSRTYTTDLANPVGGISTVYRFGVGFKDNYDIRLTGAFQANGAGRVVWPEQLNGRLFSYDAQLSAGGTPTFTSTRTTGQLGHTVRRIDASTLEYRSTSGFIMRFEPHPNGQYYRLKSIIDRNGNTTTLSYDGSNNLTSVTDAVNRSITFAYNAPNCPECVRTATDPLNRVTTYGYDTSKRLTQVTDALNKTMSYGYTGANQLASVTDRRGNVVKQIGYDANRRVISQTFADGGVERYNYTLSGTVVTGMRNLIVGCLWVMLATVASVQAQDPAGARSAAAGEEKAASQAIPSALATYTKWREATLPNYAQREATPHYAVAVVAQRLDDSTAQVEVLVAADMKHSVLTIRPVTLTRQANGEVTVTPVVGRPVVVDLKAGRKVTNGPDAIRLAETTTIVAVTRATEALEITWEPKNDRSDDPSNKVLVLLGKEPTVAVNGYISGEPVR